MVDSSVIIIDGKQGYHAEIGAGGNNIAIDSANSQVSAVGSISYVSFDNPFPGDKTDYFYALAQGLAATGGNIRLMAKLLAVAETDSGAESGLCKIYIFNSAPVGVGSADALLTDIPFHSFTSAFSSAFK